MQEKKGGETEGRDRLREFSCREILLFISSLNTTNKPLHAGSRYYFSRLSSLTSLSCVQRLRLAQVVTTEGCCGVSEP